MNAAGRYYNTCTSAGVTILQTRSTNQKFKCKQKANWDTVSESSTVFFSIPTCPQFTNIFFHYGGRFNSIGLGKIKTNIYYLHRYYSTCTCSGVTILHIRSTNILQVRSTNQKM